MMHLSSTSAPMEPGIVSQFAELLHERRSQIAPPRTSTSMYDLWAILHERELSQIDAALARIRRGSYGTCEACGSQIQYLHLFLEPTSSRCVGCTSAERRTA
jgi:hypothetical protein